MSSRIPSDAAGLNESIDWDKVEKAMTYLSNLDIVAMANHIVNQALEKGPKEAYNEAGGARYQLSKAKQHMAYLRATICKDTLQTQEQQICTLELTNQKKQALIRKD